MKGGHNRTAVKDRDGMCAYSVHLKTLRKQMLMKDSAMSLLTSSIMELVNATMTYFG